MNKYTRFARTSREAFGHEGWCIEGDRGDAIVGWGMAAIALIVALTAFVQWLGL